ncbi:SgcJ/EcaC family oxidoreductase [Kribbella sp. DT2]|uniref:SgcJ/EcaC family oxidoreductase n=1 Tax=Kribbella sp. DT2 TaxID=3393427 RepID=UPI003CF1A9C6
MTLTRDTDEDQVRALIVAAHEAQLSAAGLVPLHHRQAVLVNVAGRRVLGRDAIQEAMVAALASPLQDVLTTVDVLDVRFPVADLAVVSCVKTIDDRRAEADRGALPLTGALTYVCARVDGEWSILLAQTTPIAG